MINIAIAAHGEETDPGVVEKAEAFVEHLARECGVEDVVLLVGGYWGLMKNVVDRALSVGFKVILFPPVEVENRFAFPSNTIVLRTGLSYRNRSVVMVRSSDILVALGGASGTIQEVITAYTEAKPTLVLKSTGMPTDRLARLAPYIDDRRLARVELVESPVELAKRACHLAKSLESTQGPSPASRGSHEIPHRKAEERVIGLDAGEVKLLLMPQDSTRS